MRYRPTFRCLHCTIIYQTMKYRPTFRCLHCTIIYQNMRYRPTFRCLHCTIIYQNMRYRPTFRCLYCTIIYQNMRYRPTFRCLHCTIICIMKRRPENIFVLQINLVRIDILELSNQVSNDKINQVVGSKVSSKSLNLMYKCASLQYLQSTLHRTIQIVT